MNLFNFYAWLHDVTNLKIYELTTGKTYQGSVVGGLFNYPARSFTLDVKLDKYIYRVICSSKDGHLAVSVKATLLYDPAFATSLGQALQAKLQDYVDNVNKRLEGGSKPRTPTITISFPADTKIMVQVEDRIAENLTYEEALALVAQLLPCDKRQLNWLHSEQDRKEIAERANRHHGNEGQWP